MPKVYNINVADWTKTEFALEHNKLNAEYAEKDEFNKYISFTSLRDSFYWINEKDGFNNLLDVGCGSGWNFVYLDKEKLLDEKEIYGLDISPDMCKLAKHNYPKGTYIVTDFIKNGLNRQFDLVMESAVLELVHDWRAVLHAILKHSSKWVILHRLFFTHKDTVYQQVLTYNDDPDIRIHIGLHEFNLILNENGFEIVREDRWHKGKPYLMGTFVLRRKDA